MAEVLAGLRDKGVERGQLRREHHPLYGGGLCAEEVRLRERLRPFLDIVSVRRHLFRHRRGGHPPAG